MAPNPGFVVSFISPFELLASDVLQWWEDIRGPDGLFRNVMWVARGEGSTGSMCCIHSSRRTTANPADSITLTQLLGRGSFSKGRMTISERLNTLASVPPYLRNDLDREVVIHAFENVKKMMENVEELSWTMPPPYLSARQFVETVSTLLRAQQSILAHS